MKNCRYIRTVLSCLWLFSLSATIAFSGEAYRIEVMGDSISVGYTDNPKWTVPYEFGFRSGLYTLLTNSGMSFQFVGESPEPWDAKFGTVTNQPVIDLRRVGQDHCRGYGGMSTGFFVPRLETWLATDKPDIVLLMLSINDIAKGSDAEPIGAETNLNQIVSTILAHDSKTRVIVAQITPYSGPTGAIIRYNNYIREKLVPNFVAKGNYVSTVDQYTNLLVPGTTNIDSSVFSNGINHPNGVAYERMAHTWFAGIQALHLPSVPATK